MSPPARVRRSRRGLGDPAVAAARDAEVRTGRYANEPAVPFVREILAAARRGGDLPRALRRLRERKEPRPAHRGRPRPHRVGRLAGGGPAARPASPLLRGPAPGGGPRLASGRRDVPPPVIALQVLQHGPRARCHAAEHQAQRHLEARGRFALRVNAVGTELEPAGEEVEAPPDGSRTIRYTEGPKRGLLVPFFSAGELEGRFGARFRPALPPRRAVMPRAPPRTGHWDPREAIWRKA